MNILIFSWRGPGHPKAGGAEFVTHQHAKAWAKAGHQVTLFTSSFRGAKSEEIIEGVKIKRKGSQYLTVHLIAFFWYLSQRERYDLVIDNFHGLPFFTPLYARTQKIAYIHEVAKKVWFLNPLPWPLNLIIGVIGYFGEPFLFILYKKTLFLTGAQSTKEDLITMGIPDNNIVIIPHGITVQKSFSRNKEKRHTITYFGVLSKDKGIEDALKCFSLLKDKGNFNFWVIGRAENWRYMNKLNKLIKKFGLVGKIKMCGFVSEEVKFKLLAKSHLLINPSVTEGWGLVVIEGSAMGTPTIGYNVHGLRDSILNKKTGILCQENTAENLALNVLKLLDNKILYNRICSNSIKWSQKFSWRKSTSLSLRYINRKYLSYDKS